MLKSFSTLLFLSMLILFSCGTPNDPVSLFGDDGGYKIVSKIATIGHAQDVVVEDTLAYIAQGEGGLLIVNISDQNNPFIISSVMGEDLKGYSYKIAKKDTAIYLAAGNFGLSVVDVTNPLHPFASEVNLNAKPAKDLHVFRNFLFTSTSETGVQIAEASVSTHPELRGRMYTPGFAHGLCSSSDSNYILVACGEMGFAMFDISQMQGGYGTYPLVGWIDTPGYAEDIVTHPERYYAYLACGAAGFTIVNYGDTADMKIESNFDTGGYAKEIFYKDGKVFITTELRGLQVFDVTNVQAPVRLGTIPTSYALGVSLDDDYIYVADEDEGLIIIAHP